MMLQLDPPIPVQTPHGEGYAIVLIDYSQEHDLLWVVIMDDGGEIRSYPNFEIRGCVNRSMERIKAPAPVSGKTANIALRKTGKATLPEKNRKGTIT